jgi:small nuclear ribonucleoprotein D3
MSVGIPIKLLHESEGHVIVVEVKTSEVYRGKLAQAEDNMNCQLSEVTVTHRDGRVTHLDYIYIRGSHVRFFIVPDMLGNAPMFKKTGPKGLGIGRGGLLLARPGEFMKWCEGERGGEAERRRRNMNG